MQLYRIDPEDVLASIHRCMEKEVPTSGEGEFVNRELAARYGYPLKIAFSIKERVVTVITAYPLRRGRTS